MVSDREMRSERVNQNSPSTYGTGGGRGPVGVRRRLI